MVLWVLTAWSKLKFIARTMQLHWKLTLAVAYSVALILGTRHVVNLSWEASRAKEFQRAVEEHFNAERESYSIGLNLDNLLNDYRAKTKDMAVHDDSPLSADSLQRVNARIAASNATASRDE